MNASSTNGGSPTAADRHTFHASGGAWIAVLVVWGPLLLIGAGTALTSGSIATPPLVLGLLGAGSTVGLLRAVRLSWTEEELEYSSAFRRWSIRFADIKFAQIGLGSRRVYRPTFALRVVPKGAGPELEINLKLFSGETIRRLRDALNARGIGVDSRSSR